jgi:UDP-GlcNAc:undecaprenyl-phosphate GlcNAc-1-phosphate transferase
MLVGLVLGTLSLRGAGEMGGPVPMAVPLALFTLPILDTAAAIVRRKLTGRSIYCTDRGHLHHCLLRLGLSRERVLLIVITLSVLTATGAVAGGALHNDLLPLAAAGTCAAILIVPRLFGHAEVLLIVRRMQSLARSLAGLTAARGHQLEVRLQGSADWTDLWGQLTARACELNLRTIYLDVNAPAVHEGYHATWQGPDRAAAEDQGDTWSAEIPLNARGQTVGRLSVSGWRDRDPVWTKVAAMTAVAEKVEAQLHRLAGVADAPPTPVLVQRPVDDRLDAPVAALE